MKKIMNKFMKLSKKLKVIISLSALCVVTLGVISSVYVLSHVDDKSKVAEKVDSSTKDEKKSSKEKSKEDKKKEDEKQDKAEIDKNSETTSSNDIVKDSSTSDTSNGMVNNSSNNTSTGGSSTTGGGNVTPPPVTPPVCPSLGEGSYVSDLTGGTYYYKQFLNQAEAQAFHDTKLSQGYHLEFSTENGLNGCTVYTVEWS